MPNIIYRAQKTEEAIAAAMEADQGNAYRAALQKHIPNQLDAYRHTPIDDPFRSHLGASMIGRKCERELWYGFHWSTIKRFDGRILRLFNTGHLAEAKFLAMLESIGCVIYQVNEDGTQYRMDGHGGHYGGSLDGVVTNLPDWPNGPVLAEFKTHGDKSFAKLQKEGVRSAKPEHVAQMQQYMAAYQLPIGIYMAINKNDEMLYTELIHFEEEQAGQDYAKAGRIIASDAPPKRISNSPGWLACKFCDHHAICHLDAPVAVNCRTCAFVTCLPDGGWRCENDVNQQDEGFEQILSKDAQLAGCQNHEPFTAYIED